MSSLFLLELCIDPLVRTLNPFRESINRTPEKITTDKLACYFMEGVNIDLLRFSVHLKTSGFLDAMYANGFILLINRPTRVTSQSATIIDHLYTNNLNVSNAVFKGILVIDITNHYPIFHMCCLFNSSCSNETDEYFNTQRMNSSNSKTFKMLISRNDWNGVIDKTTCGDAFGSIYAYIKSCYHQAVPLIRMSKIVHKACSLGLGGSHGCNQSKKQIVQGKPETPHCLK